MRLGIGGWRRSVTRRLCWLAMSAVVASCAAAGHPPAPVHPPAAVPSGPVHGGTGPCWLISLNAIHLLQGAGASEGFIERLFDNPRTYVIVGPRQTNPLKHSVTVANFTNFAYDRATRSPGIEAAMTGLGLNPAVGAVSYDDENWQFTPRPEIAAPLRYTRLAAAMVHRAGRKFISTPAMDLGVAANGRVQRLPQSFHTFVSDGYLNLARYDDVFELQLENAETAPYFTSLAREAARKVKAVNPRVIFMLQLTSNPNRQQVSAKQLIRDFRATRGFVDGYALTIPDSPAVCPACGQPRPATLLAFLRWYDNKG